MRVSRYAHQRGKRRPNIRERYVVHTLSQRKVYIHTYTNEPNRILYAKQQNAMQEYTCACAKERMHFSRERRLHPSLSRSKEEKGRGGRKEGREESRAEQSSSSRGTLLAGTSILMGMGFSTFGRHMLPR